MDSAEVHALNSAIRTLAMRHRARAAQLEAELGLHPGQEFVVMALADKGPMVQRELAREVGCEPPSITLMVRKLEAVGYVSRRPSTTDRRATVVELTAQGEALLEHLDEIWQTLAEETIGDIDQPLDQIITVLQDLAAQLGRVDPTDPTQPPAAH